MGRGMGGPKRAVRGASASSVLWGGDVVLRTLGAGGRIERRYKLVLPRAETRGLLHCATRVEVSVGPGSSAGEVRWWGGCGWGGG